MINHYLHRLYDSIASRRHIDIESFTVDDLPDKRNRVKSRLTFIDGSLLDFYEVVFVYNGQIIKGRYAYHYQDASNKLFFRYDNAPHHPYIFTYPHHKHIGSAVEPSSNPDLGDVLSEIEGLLWAE